MATEFTPLSLEIRYPDSAMLLLKSPERPILLAAAAALTNYGERARPNLERLAFDLDVVVSVLGLIEHEDIFTRRFALKLLALMSVVPNVRAHLLKTDTYIAFFTDVLVGESDVFLQEFASRILAELSSDPIGSAMFLEKYPDVSFLFEKLQATDPDVKKNCIEIVDNLLKDFDAVNDVFYSKAFSFGAIYELFRQPYPIIQELALDVIEHFVMHNADDYVQESFRLSGGVQHLLDILESDEWNDLHYKVLHIFDLACDNSKTAELMNSADGTKRLFGFMENTNNNDFKFEALKVLIRLAENMNGKKLLHSRGLVKYMVKLFEISITPEMQAIICQGLAKMASYAPAAEEISQENPLDYVLNLLNNDQAQWSERQAAAFALKVILASDYQSCINFLEIKGQVHLIHLIKQSVNAVPWETQVTVVQAISAIADYSSLAQDLIDFDIFSALCSFFEQEFEIPADLKIACCNALTRFPAILPSSRKHLVQGDILRKLYPLISDTESVPVRIAATRLLLLLFADPILANLAVQEGYLIYLLKNRSVSRVITPWNACLESLFNADLPMKFAYTGRLSLRDITADGFYAMRRSSCPFPVLEELFKLKLCPLEPIYVANFSETCLDDTKQDDYLAGKQAAFEAARETIRRESLERGIRVSEGTIKAWLELKFGRLQPDPDLRRCLEMFKAELAASDEQHKGSNTDTTIQLKLVNIGSIAPRAQLLGRFVARQLSGPLNRTAACVDQQLELHLRALKERLETSVIPLGMLRCGSRLERALLFKVLADRVGLPASLVRGRYGGSWIEIPVPLTEASMNSNSPFIGEGKDQIAKSNVSKINAALPTKYLRENFIVDLMDEPGDLIPIGSAQARKFHDPCRPVCKFACCN